MVEYDRTEADHAHSVWHDPTNHVRRGPSARAIASGARTTLGVRHPAWQQTPAQKIAAAEIPGLQRQASGGSRPIETVAGHPGIDHRPDRQTPDAQRLDDRAAGLAAGDDQPPGAGVRPAHRARPASAASTRLPARSRPSLCLRPPHLVGCRARIDEHWAIADMCSARPVDRLGRIPACGQARPDRGATSARARHGRDLGQSRRGAGAGQHDLATGYRRQRVGRSPPVPRSPVRRKFSGRPMAMPEPPVSSARSAAGRPQPAQILVLDRVGDGVGAAVGPQARRSGRGSHRARAGQRRTEPGPPCARSAACSTRTRLAVGHRRQRVVCACACRTAAGRRRTGGP